MGNAHPMLPPVPTAAERGASVSKSIEIVNNNNMNKSDDPFRDGYLRYLGYASVVGDSLRRHISHPVYLASYAVATAYVCADTAHKAQNSYQRGDSMPRILINAGDAFLWQTLASIIVPGYVVNRVSYLTRRLVRLKRKKCICKANPVIRYSPIAVGLLAIPLLMQPIDAGVGWAMDNTVRKLYQGVDDGKK